MQLKNNVFIITGGASGLGLGCVRRFAKAGAKIIIADMNATEGEKLARDLTNQVEFVQTNVADEKSAQNIVDYAWKKFGNLHGLVNCAGIAVADKVINKDGSVHPLEAFTKVINVNLIGTFNLTRLAVQAIVKNSPGLGAQPPTETRAVIINTASVAAFDGQIGQTAYSASKGGVVAMTLPLARECSRFGIRVLTIAPGIFETPMLGALPQAARESLGKQVPFPQRLGSPDEYAALAEHCIENEMLNGEVIRLDGAIRMAPK